MTRPGVAAFLCVLAIAAAVVPVSAAEPVRLTLEDAVRGVRRRA